MTEHLPPCWSCGSKRTGHTNDLVVCYDCGAGPEREHIWRSRALGPALDVVLEAVEALSAHDRLFETWRHNQHLSGQTAALYMLRTLRDSARTEAGEEG